jgi:hypothetical protein
MEGAKHLRWGKYLPLASKQAFGPFTSEGNQLAELNKSSVD